MIHDCVLQFINRIWFMIFTQRTAMSPQIPRRASGSSCKVSGTRAEKSSWAVSERKSRRQAYNFRNAVEHTIVNMSRSREALHALLLHLWIGCGALTYQNDSSLTIVNKFGSKLQYRCKIPLTLMHPYEPVLDYTPAFQCPSG